MQDLQTKTKKSATEILRTRNHKITEAARQQYIENVTQEALDASIVRMFRFNNAQVLELTSQKGAFEFDAEKGVDENGKEVNREVDGKEMLSIQGFPIGDNNRGLKDKNGKYQIEEFKFVVSDNQLKKQAGNSMAVQVMAALLKQLLIK